MSSVRPRRPAPSLGLLGRPLAAAALGLCLAGGASPALAAPGAPPAGAPAADAGPGTSAVKAANETIAALLKQRAPAGSKEEQALAAKVTSSVRDFLDIDQLGQLALADHWATMTPAQQAEFSRLLRALIEDSYVKGLRANLTYAVEYTGEKAAGGDVLVETQVKTTRNQRPYAIKVSYVLRPAGGKLRAFDVKTDGVGLVENYKLTFDKLIKKDGVDGLIAKMKKKQAGGAAAK